MTHDEMIAVITAHKEGKTTETRRRVGGKEWFIFEGPMFDFVNYEHRIKSLPIPPGDLTWEEATELHKQGVKVQYLSKYDCVWHNCDGFDTLSEGYAYRRTPIHRKVPLGPEDVPPGSVVRHPKREADAKGWAAVLRVRSTYVVLQGCSPTYEGLQSDGWLIKRPGQDWAKAEKDEVQS